MYKLLINVLIIGLYFIGYFIFHFAPNLISIYLLFDEFIILMMIGLLVLNALKNNTYIFNKMIFQSSGIKMVILFYFLSFLSLIANQTNIILFVNFYFSLIKPICFFIFFSTFIINRSDFDNYKKLFLIIFNIQIFMNLLWMFGINPLPNITAYPDPDFGIGTLGSETSREVSYLLTIYFFIILTSRKSKKSNLSRLRKFGLLSLIIFSILLTEAKSTIAIIIITYIFTGFFINFNKSIKTFIPTTLFVIGILYLSAQLFPNIFILSKLYFANRAINSPKVLAYTDSIIKIPELTNFKYFGAGPGVYASPVALKNKTKLSSDYVLKTYGSQAYSNSEIEVSGISFMRTTGFTSIIGDIGIFGFLVYISIFIRIFFYLIKKKRIIKKYNSEHIIYLTSFLLIYNAIIYDLFTIHHFMIPYFVLLTDTIHKLINYEFDSQNLYYFR